MGKHNRIPTIQANFKVEPGLVNRVRQEAKKEGMYPGAVLSIRLRHSYAVSPDSLPSDTDAHNAQ